MDFNRIGERIVKGLDSIQGSLSRLAEKISVLVKNPNPPIPKQNDVRVQMNNQPPDSKSFKSGIVESPKGNIVQERHSIELNKQMQAIKENNGSILSASQVKIRGFHSPGMGAIETNIPGSMNSEKNVGNTATIEYDHERGQYKLIVTQDLFNKPRSITFNGQELTKGDEVYFDKGQNTISIGGQEIFKITL
ncbi:MAG: hypothetical protein H0T62_12270 [Parachlamydiaceae bacterium]|nr:hypothetical protein [Parachlamydiaceae bacterium]